MKDTYRSFIVPPGRYWLTDPCYVISDHEDWIAYLRSCDAEDRSTTEYQELLKAADLGKALGYRLNGHYLELPGGAKVLTFSTACGDGVYTDQSDANYSVDSGLLGLVPYEYAPEYTLKGAGKLVEFSEEALCFTRDGILTFGKHIIDTAKECGTFEAYEI